MFKAPSMQSTKKSQIPDIITKLNSDTHHPHLEKEQYKELPQDSKSKPKYKRLKKKVCSKTCTICLNAISCENYAQLKSCSHQFCFECILDWAKIYNTCPVCRKPFSLINRSYKELVKLYFYHDDACVKCKKSQPENLLVPCFTCEKIFVHKLCNQPQLLGPEEIPKWTCSICLIGQLEESVISSFHSPSREDSEYVLSEQEGSQEEESCKQSEQEVDSEDLDS